MARVIAMVQDEEAREGRLLEVRTRIALSSRPLHALHLVYLSHFSTVASHTD